MNTSLSVGLMRIKRSALRKLVYALVSGLGGIHTSTAAASCEEAAEMAGQLPCLGLACGSPS